MSKCSRQPVPVPPPPALSQLGTRHGIWGDDSRFLEAESGSRDRAAAFTLKELQTFCS